MLCKHESHASEGRSERLLAITRLSHERILKASQIVENARVKGILHARSRHAKIAILCLLGAASERGGVDKQLKPASKRRIRGIVMRRIGPDASRICVRARCGL